MKLVLGQCYFVRTTTDHWVGRLVSIDGPNTYSLTEASWVANSGRLSIFMKEGKAENMEIEPVGEVGRVTGAILPWPHPLFTEAV